MRLILFCLSFLLTLATFAKEKVALPFTFLNQYFEYSVNQNDEVFISGKKISFNSDFIKFTESKLQIKSDEFLKPIVWNIYFKNSAGKVIDNVKKIDLKNDYTSDVINEATVKDTTSVCLASANRYTQVIICKSIGASATNNQSQVFINGSLSQKQGRIILTQPNEKISLEIKFGSQDVIKVSTVKRQFLPSEIEKDSSKEVYDIKFYDLVDKLYSWTDSIGYEQESFIVPNDNIISVQQDFFNKDYSKKDVRMTYYKPQIPRKSISNMYAFNPFLTFSNLIGNTSSQNLNLQSKMGFGLRGYFNTEFDKKNDFLSKFAYFDFMSFNGSFKKNEYISSLNSYTINNNDSFFYNISAGLSKIYDPDFYYGPFINISKDSSIDKTAGASQIGLGSMLNLDAGVQAHYLVFERGHFQSNIFSGLSLMLPAQYSGETTTLFSPRLYLQADVGYREINTAYFFGFYYGYRQQETSSQKIKDQNFDYTFNYTVYF